LLSAKPAADNLAEFNGLKTFYKPAGNAAIEKQIITFLATHAIKIDDIDLIITGKNGDTKNDEIYKQVKLFSGKPQGHYKHLCGDYATSSSFALWVAANCVKNGNVPDIVAKESTQPKKVLIYNHYQNIYHSLMLISAC
jgi:3-oxoacyl-[acyl-carrier-protein] synthase II